MGYGCVRRVRFVVVVVVGSAVDGNGCLCGLLRMRMGIVMVQRVTCGLTAGARERWRCSLMMEYAEIILTLEEGRKCCDVGEMHDVRRTADSGRTPIMRWLGWAMGTSGGSVPFTLHFLWRASNKFHFRMSVLRTGGRILLDKKVNVQQFYCSTRLSS
jgi:hypothetical protein